MLCRGKQKEAAAPRERDRRLIFPRFAEVGSGFGIAGGRGRSLCLRGELPVLVVGEFGDHGVIRDPCGCFLHFSLGESDLRLRIEISFGRLNGRFEGLFVFGKWVV